MDKLITYLPLHVTVKIFCCLARFHVAILGERASWSIKEVWDLLTEYLAAGKYSEKADPGLYRRHLEAKAAMAEREKITS